VKQQYRHTKPIRGKDPFFENEEIEEIRNETSCPVRLDEGKPSKNQKRFGNKNEKPLANGFKDLEI